MKIFWKYIALLTLLVVSGCEDELYYQGFPSSVFVSVDGSENDHDYVDLGLPSGIKWATCNVGASKPEDYGSYFAWGETTTKSGYTWSNLTYCLDSNGNKFSKYVSNSSYGTVDNKTTLELSDDAARANWGGKWRMPTSSEIDELLNNCTWTWTTQNGVKGYKVTGKKSGYTGKSIFLPAAGYRDNDNLYTAGSFGIYWSSSLDTDYSATADLLHFSSSGHYRDYNNRYFGLSVRPVCPSGSYVSVTGVKLNTTSVSLEVGDTTTLTATISPSNATDKSVTWSSSNTSVATVDSIGNVTAKSAGTATITVTTTDGNKTATCTVTVTFKQENGHDYVDLGLPSGIKWATCNIGASKPEEYGSYFAWGETTTKSSYTWSNLTYCLDNNGNKFSKYVFSSSYGTVDNRTTLELSDDAARANWGGRWRMPTATEIDELKNNCAWTWTTLNGVNGYKVTGKKSGYTGKSIFLPAAGYRDSDDLYDAGSYGDYWSSSLYMYNSYYAYELYIDSSDRFRYDIGSRCCGRSVRPVCPSDNYVSVTGVELSTTSVSLEVGDTTTLTATVSPSNATDKSVTWESNNTSVAIVDSIGKITAKSAGTATITVTTTDGNFTATCTVTVTSPQSSSDGSENGHDYVDLGLPSGIKWATCNIGASKPEEYGSYFAWGETVGDPYIEGKDDGYSKSFDWSTYKYCNGSSTTMTKYCTDSSYGTVDNKTTLELSDDAARANWGGKWRMPTITEIDELFDNCTWEWTTQNGVNGYKVTGKKSGYTDKSIFLPAAGYRDSDSLGIAGSYSNYWSSSLGTDFSSDADVLEFVSGSHGRRSVFRYYGLSVRPVCPSDNYVSVTGVELNTSSLSLETGGTATLTATVSPSDATDKSVTWKSSNTSVVTVDSNGKITAKSAGTATITVTTTDGNIIATCTVTVTSPQSSSDGSENGHDYVDLGLPSGVKWATCNIGASKPEDYGSYFAWGETVGDPYIEGKDDGYSKSFDWSTYKYCNGSSTTMTKYCTDSSYGTVDNKTKLELSDDAAHVNWGGSWRMPTATEIDELLNNCTWEWTTQNGVSGYKVTGKKSGYTDKSIFLPAAGYRSSDNLYNAGSGGDYWFSSLDMGNSSDAYVLYFNSSGHSRYRYYRYYGQSVRPVCPSDNYVSVTGVELNTTSLSLETGGTATLTATVSPSDATDKSVTWKSSNTSVATVDSNGKITAKSAGTAVITVTTTDGNFTATCTVTVKSQQVSVTEVKLNTTSVSLEVGGTTTLTATISPSNATDKSVTWTSDNTSVATVDSIGNVTAKSAGTATITVTTTDGNTTATCTITVKTPQIVVTSVSLNTSSLSLEVGGTTTLTATVSPSNATDKSVQWSSSNTDVATVDSIGNVTAKSAGTAVITVTTTDGNTTATCTITVKTPQIVVTSVSLNTSSLSLEVGGTTTLTATVSPSNATDKSVQWSSSNTDVATVDSIGNVTAKSAGTATITVTTTDGSNTATCTVTVTSPQSSSDGSENGHDYVDLGLPSGIKWATCNVGASKPEDYGSYFAWGETTTKSSYHWSSLTYCLDNNGNKFSKYVSSSSYGTVDDKTTLELSDDAARANWGGSWRMPTITEIDELLNNCTWERTTQNGVNGYKVTGKKFGYTDKSIFLPAAGYRGSVDLDDAGSSGNYWSSSLYTDGSDGADLLYFDSDGHARGSSGRFYGHSVRPVCPSDNYVSVTGVELNTTSLSLETGGTATLTATVSPSNATDKSVTWKSSNTSVATVDINGKITAKSAGSAVITVTTTDGSNTSTCTVTVKSQQSSGGKENGHDYVDLGLPSGIKWATCNVGASKPEEYGSYFAWGETTTKSSYTWSNLTYCLDSNSNKFSKYVSNSSYGTVDNKTTLELSDDAAHVNWGSSWRMPTATEIDELLNNCTWEWTTQNGVYGYKVTGNKSGYTNKSIFLPAAGYHYYDGLSNAGSVGSYWSSSLGMSDSLNAFGLYFNSSGHYRCNYDRNYGLSVRPVCP